MCTTQFVSRCGESLSGVRGGHGCGDGAAREGVESVAALAATQAASVEAAGTSMKYQQT